MGKELERALGPTGFWTLLVGAGSPGPLVDLARDLSPDFRHEFLAAGRDLSQKQWEQILGRGDFFQLCELISKCPVVFDQRVGGHTLLSAVDEQAPRVAACSTWYERNSGVKGLAECPASSALDAAHRALSASLAEIAIDSLSFPDLHEAVNGLELLYERRPDARAALAARLWDMLPPPERWRLDPKNDMALPRILLGIVAQPEFLVEDVDRVIGGVVQCLAPKVMAKCRTVDILWTLWALFACSRRRNGIAPESFSLGQKALLKSAATVLTLRAAEPCTCDELRARFAMLGLLVFFGILVAPSAVTALGAKLENGTDTGAWWLCADQNFVTAWLVLRGFEAVRPLPDRQKRYFVDRLLGAAAGYPEIDPAAEYLRTQVESQKVEFDAVHGAGVHRQGTQSASRLKKGPRNDDGT